MLKSCDDSDEKPRPRSYLEKAKVIAEPALLAAANRRRAQEQREWDEGFEARLTEVSRGLVGL